MNHWQCRTIILIAGLGIANPMIAVSKERNGPLQKLLHPDGGKSALDVYLEQAGAVLTTVEGCVFEWIGGAGHPQFKEISRLVQRRMQHLSAPSR